MSDLINVGDRVNVFFDGRVEPEMNVEVLGIPDSARDSWRLKRMGGGLVYVQTFSKMIRTLESPIQKIKILIKEVSEIVSQSIEEAREEEGPFKDSE